ncbi:MAG: [FeFe] hydrogenase H-cluster maturation GTPase HydF [bacterium]
MKRGAPRGMRLHIGLFGRRNVGKSSLLNIITQQQVSIVSRMAGTTTDPVEKPMELLPLGPVLFIDTAGIDDDSDLGSLRIEKTRRAMNRTDLGVIVTEGSCWGRFEERLLHEFQSREIPIVVVFNKIDRSQPPRELVARLTDEEIPTVSTAAITGFGTLELRQALLEATPDELVNRPGILGEVVTAGDWVVLVVPIDKEAPKGRLILPQNQTIRDILDHEAQCIVVKENKLRSCLASLQTLPDLVITDSQVFGQVARETPSSVKLTSFSILFANWKGNLPEFVRGTLAIDRLRPGDRVLIAEACTHHPIEDDIGRVKIPCWLNEHVGGDLVCEHVRGHDFPGDVGPFKLVIHCGACMFNRREVLTRMLQCRKFGVPITNYGLTIAHAHGILARALTPFPSALDILREADLCA